MARSCGTHPLRHQGTSPGASCCSTQPSWSLPPWRAPGHGANELAAHVAHLGKGVLHPGPGLGNALVAPLLAFAQRLACLGLALDVLAIPQGLEHLAALCAGVAPVGIDVGAGVVLVQYFIKVRAVVLAGRAGGD